MTKVDEVVMKMNKALDRMHKALVSRNYDDFEKADIEFDSIWNNEVEDEMLVDDKQERRIYRCNAKFFQLRKAWCEN